MVKCVKCHSRNVIESEKGIYCCSCGWDSEKEEYVKRITNADRIRSMSDEELAEFLVNFKNTYGDEYEGEMSCLDWLKSEIKN